MNTKNLLIGVLILVVGFGLGYSFKKESNESVDHVMTIDAMMESMVSNLEGKSGDAFDEAFIREMVVHHQGAIAMAQLAKDSAKHQEIKALAEAIISAQTGEIAKMEGWLKAWYNAEIGPITSGENPAPGSIHDMPVEPAAAAARKDLATKLKIDEKSIVIMQVAEMTWSDGCLGLGGAAESCLAAITPGFKVEMLVNGKTYIYRTDKTGASVRAETQS